MNKLMKPVLVVLFLSVGYNSANAGWVSAEEMCERFSRSDGGWSFFCNNGIGYIQTGRSIFGRFATMGGELREAYLNSSGRVRRVKMYITRRDNSHTQYCYRTIEVSSDDVRIDEETANTLLTIRRCR